MAKLPSSLRVNIKPHIEARIHEAMLEKNSKPSSRDGRLGMSQLGGCERNLWAGLHGVANDPGREFSGRILTLFEHGNVVEDHVVSLLKLAGFAVAEVDPATGEQWRISDFDDKLVGHTDGLIRISDKANWSLLEIKSSNTRKFDELLEVGYEDWNPTYSAQVHLYMHYSGLVDALAVVYCKEDSRIHAERIAGNHKKAKSQIEKASRIIEATSAPAKPPEAKNKSCPLCKWCDRKEWCWGPLADVQFDD